ncbi:MAG: hypothetical protein FJ390_04625 [Verrucomicrobia bacterium]|nr:hypothetical protein [Verrucomicrobiota bacterium]
MKNKTFFLVLSLFLGSFLVPLQAMPPKPVGKAKAAEEKDNAEKKQTAEDQEEQERRITGSSDDDLSSEEERGIIIGAKEEVKSDDELSKFDSTDGSEEVVANTLESQRPTTPFRTALARHREATQFIIVEENGNLVFKTPRSSSYYDQWKRLETLNFLRWALREEYGKRARTIVVDVIGASNLTNDNHLSAPRLREILERADNNTAFFDSDIHYLGPVRKR